MKKITNEEMVQNLLSIDPYKYIYTIGDLCSIKHTPLNVISCKVDKTCKYNLIVQSLNKFDNTLHFLIEYESEDFLEECINELPQLNDKTFILVSTKNKLFENIVFKEKYQNTGIRESKLLKWSEGKTLIVSGGFIFRKIQYSDKDRISFFQDNDPDNMADYFFDCCVTHPEFDYGHHYGLFNTQNEIIGYIVYDVIYGNICDVKHVYVGQNNRGNSYASIMANGYGINAFQNGMVALYSNPANIQSEMTALNSGFAYYSTEYVATECRKT